MKKYIYLLVFLTIMYSCNTNRGGHKINLIGNWSAVYKDTGKDRIVYQEIYFSKDTMKVFDLDCDLHLPYKYNLKNNTIYITPSVNDSIIKGKITFKNPNHLVIDYDTWENTLIRISDDGWSVDSLIKTGIYKEGVPDSIKNTIHNDFIDYQFRVREIKCYLYHGIENKKALINNWKSMIEDTMYNHDDEYLQYLINYFEDYKKKK